MQKIALLTRLAERVRVPSTILCASVTGLGNCTYIPLELSGLFENFPDL